MRYADFRLGNHRGKAEPAFRWGRWASHSKGLECAAGQTGALRLSSRATGEEHLPKAAGSAERQTDAAMPSPPAPCARSRSLDRVETSESSPRVTFNLGWVGSNQRKGKSRFMITRSLKCRSISPSRVAIEPPKRNSRLGYWQSISVVVRGCGEESLILFEVYAVRTCRRDRQGLELDFYPRKHHIHL